MGRPKCPNHGCEMDKTNTPRTFICPVSGYRFDCDVDAQAKTVKRDKYGRPLTSFTVTPLDGSGG